MRLLMKVLKNLFGNNTKINANDIAIRNIENKAVTLDNFLSNATIYESGSNNNGSWIKYTNGILIQWGKQQFSINFSDFWGMKASPTFRIRYPIKFIENTSCCSTISSGSESWLITASQQGTTIESQEFRIARPNGLGDGDATIILNFQAMGRWK